MFDRFIHFFRLIGFWLVGFQLAGAAKIESRVDRELRVIMTLYAQAGEEG